MTAVRGRHVDDTRPTDDGAPSGLFVKGGASAEEIAAVTAVLSRLLNDSEEPEPPAAAARARSTWNRRSDLLRRPSFPGPGAWRASGWRV